ncbi:MAG: hypothetical protein ACPGVI_00965 [Crocinitomicaceae bacterium]
MKWICGLAILVFSMSAYGQRDLTPSKRGSVFGKRDFRNLRNFGLQVQLGPTYLMTNRKNELVEVNDHSIPYHGSYLNDQYGKVGAFAEIGLMHFPKKRSGLSRKLKTILVSYYDWGLGFKYFRGGEIVESTSSVANSATEKTDFKLGHGNVYGRFSIHKNIHFKTNGGQDKANFFLDNSLGINIDYRLLDQSAPYVHPAALASVEYNPLHVQLHYGLGFGYKLKRGSYLIPGVRLPILGYQSTAGAGSSRTVIGKPSMHWFSSRYWPILFHIKYMFVFEKKTKGCAPGMTNDQDKETQRNR